MNSTNHGTSALWSGNGVQVVAGSNRKTTILVDTRREKLKLLAGQAHTWLKVALVLGTLGLVAMAFGFGKWYTKIQIYEDAILERRAKEPQAIQTPSLASASDGLPKGDPDGAHEESEINITAPPAGN